MWVGLFYFFIFLYPYKIRVATKEGKKNDKEMLQFKYQVKIISDTFKCLFLKVEKKVLKYKAKGYENFQVNLSML